MNEIEEFECHIGARSGEGAVDGVPVVVIDSIMLVVKRVMEDPAADRAAGEHAFYEGFEFDVAVVELCWDWASELDLVCLETGHELITNAWMCIGEV